MTADEHSEIHAMLGQQISLLAGQVERGFTATRQDIAGMVNRVHERLDHHVETMHADGDPGSDASLPGALVKCKAWVNFILVLGALLGGCLGILYALYLAAERGVFK